SSVVGFEPDFSNVCIFENSSANISPVFQRIGRCLKLQQSIVLINLDSDEYYSCYYSNIGYKRKPCVQFL
ncbi:MAG TPA: hypothetical protein DCR45_05835, partial [Gammaproteobacteria bacterium]|nr:hypothetical protein [Gammaproteobacteria bacterium]